MKHVIIKTLILNKRKFRKFTEWTTTGLMDKKAYHLFFSFWVEKELKTLYILLPYLDISVSICLFLNLSPFESLASLLTGSLPSFSISNFFGKNHRSFPSSFTPQPRHNPSQILATPLPLSPMLNSNIKPRSMF